MTKQIRFTRLEKVFMVSVVLFFVVMIAVLVWFQVTNTNPQVIIPTSVMPSPNAFDYYVKACDSLKSITLTAPGDTLPGHGDSLSFDQLEYLLSKGKTLGKGPGIVASLHENGVTPEPSLAEIQMLIRANAPAFSMLRQGFQYEYRESPPLRSFTQLFPHYSRFRGMARALEVVGYVKSSAGDWNGAKDANLDSVQMGVEVPHGGPMIGMLVGIAVQAIGRSDLWSTLDHLNGPQAKAGAQRMERILDRQQPFADTLQEDEWGAQASLLEIFHKPGWRKELARLVTDPSNNPLPITRTIFISKRRVMDNITRYMNVQIANARLPYAAPKATPPEPRDPISRTFIPLFIKASIKEAMNRTQNALLTVSFALRAYYADHGQYPATLQELTPGYLHAIPADPFALSGTVCYKRTGMRYVLYSVGPDGKDDGGKSCNTGRRLLKTRKHQQNSSAQGATPQSKGDVVAGMDLY